MVGDNNIGDSFFNIFFSLTLTNMGVMNAFTLDQITPPK